MSLDPLRRYESILRDARYPFPCPLCDEEEEEEESLILSIDYENHCETEHDLSPLFECVWCLGAFSWDRRRKNKHVDSHLIPCFRRFFIEKVSPGPESSERIHPKKKTAEALPVDHDDEEEEEMVVVVDRRRRRRSPTRKELRQQQQQRHLRELAGLLTERARLLSDRDRRQDELAAMLSGYQTKLSEWDRFLSEKEQLLLIAERELRQQRQEEEVGATTEKENEDRRGGAPKGPTPRKPLEERQRGLKF